MNLPAIACRLGIALSAAAGLAASAFAQASKDCGCTKPAAAPCPAPPIVVEEPPRTSWVFMRSRYTHDPATGARVAQYDMKPAIEPLDDPRLVTSGYGRTRTVIRGIDGTSDTYYRVTNYGNGRGGLDAEWERFHDAWRGSTVGGGGYFQGGYGGFVPGGFGGFPGWGLGGNGGVGPGFPAPWNYPPAIRTDRRYGPLGLGPGYGYGPGYGVPDPGRLDPDGADGYREQFPREPDEEFFNGDIPGT
jgi:hypothetical protein